MRSSKAPVKVAGKMAGKSAGSSAKGSKGTPQKDSKPGAGSKLSALKSLVFGNKKSAAAGAGKKAAPAGKAAPAAPAGKAASAKTPATAAKTAAPTAGKKAAGNGKAAPAAASAKAVAVVGKAGAKGAAAPVTGKAAAGKALPPLPALTKPTKAAKASLGATAMTRSHSEEVCREVACEGLATTAGYCRMHYIKNWKKIKRKELILKEKKLNQYIEELVAKYPDKYIEAIRQDLANDKDFAKVIHDLDLDESIDDFEMEGESVDTLIDSIKRDFEDEGESF